MMRLACIKTIEAAIMDLGPAVSLRLIFGAAVAQSYTMGTAARFTRPSKIPHKR